MNNEFRLAKGIRIFLYVVMPLLAIGFIYMGVSPFLEPPSSPSLSIFLPVLSIVLCAFLAWGFIDLQKGKVVLEDDRILQVSAFGNKELPASQVKGFTQEENYVIIHPVEEGFPKIKVSTSIGQLEEFKETLALRFPNLDEQRFEEEVQQLLEAEALGDTEEERVLQLQKVRKLTSAINTLSWVSCLWLFFYPQPYEVAIYTAMAFTPVVLYIVYRYKGLVKIDENPKSAYPNLSTALLLPSISLGLRALLDYSIFEYDRLWVSVIIATLVLYCIALWVTRAYTNGKQFATSLLVLLFLGCFSYGVLVQFNCMNDQSVTQVYSTNVMDKRTSSGKSTTYYLKLERWGPQTESDEVAVSRELYNRVQKGQLMQVYFKKGRINVPWFFVTD